MEISNKLRNRTTKYFKDPIWSCSKSKISIVIKIMTA